MKTLCLASAAADTTSSTLPLLVDPPPQGSAGLQLHRSDDGSLFVEPIPTDDTTGKSTNKTLLGFLCPGHGSSSDEWVLIPAHAELGLNCLTPPLPLTHLEPGSLLSFRNQFWMVTWKWSPTSVTVPEELADKPCAVCGADLSLAPAVQCPCGRWTHFENPDAPDDLESLNCYVESRVCGGCSRPTSLEPQLVPALPEKLATTSDVDEWDV